MANGYDAQAERSKKAWTVPQLTVLGVGATMGADAPWQFVPEGDFYKRIQLLES